MSDDLFADDYIPLRKRSGRSIDQILEDISSNRDNKKIDRWQKNTREPVKAGPESKVKARIKKHLERVYHAKVIRTNAGSITDQSGHTIYLGETGQSDLHAIIPIEIDGYLFGIFAAIETKAGLNIATDYQEKYLQQIADRGGIHVVAKSTEDVDKVILEKMLEIQMKFASR